MFACKFSPYPSIALENYMKNKAEAPFKVNFFT